MVVIVQGALRGRTLFLIVRKGLFQVVFTDATF